MEIIIKLQEIKVNECPKEIYEAVINGEKPLYVMNGNGEITDIVKKHSKYAYQLDGLKKGFKIEATSKKELIELYPTYDFCTIHEGCIVRLRGDMDIKDLSKNYEKHSYLLVVQNNEITHVIRKAPNGRFYIQEDSSMSALYKETLQDLILHLINIGFKVYSQSPQLPQRKPFHKSTNYTTPEPDELF